jgi:hypothetical protein
MASHSPIASDADPAAGRNALDADALIAEASARSNLLARGMESFRPGLERFVADYNRARNTTEAGRATTRQWILDVLAARYAVEDWIGQHPRILDEQVKRPVFIVGLPRAGTTMLMNVLSKDDRHRFYWNWEANREVPPARAAHMHDDPRIALKVREIEGAITAGILDPRHHVELGDEPTECGGGLLAQDFKSYLWPIQAQVPDYFDWWLDEADMTAAFRHHKRGLQLMQSNAPGTWILKHPCHALFIAEMVDVYPDARFIVTHRDPVNPVGSSCSIIRHLLLQGNETVDDGLIGREVLKLQAQSMQRLEAARQAHPDTPFLDLHYRALLADPMGQIGRIYAFLEEELTDEVAQKMRDKLAESRTSHSSHGRHEYRLSDFHLSQQDIEAAFDGYVDRYGIEREVLPL